MPQQRVEPPGADAAVAIRPDGIMVAAVSGSCFGLALYIRLSYAASGADLTKAIGRISLTTRE